MIENESRIAEREARRWALGGELISTQSAREIASWYHSGQWSRAYSIASSGIVPADADRLDFVSDKEYESLGSFERAQIDALMAWIEVERIVQHEGDEL